MSDGALVLIADDAVEILEAYGEILRDAGFRVAFAHDGLEAVAQALALRPDVILMDLSMPAIDGWEATRRIRADLRTHYIPIVAFTGYTLRRYADRSFAAGCAAFVEKPCRSAGALVEQLQQLLARRTPLGVVVGPLGDVGSGAQLLPRSPRR